MSLTIAYKCGYIHFSYFDGDKCIVRVQVDRFAYAIEVNTVLHAKRLITKHLRGLDALRRA